MAKTKTTTVKNKQHSEGVKKHYKVRANCVTYTCRYEGCKKKFPNASNRLVHEQQHKDETHPCSQCSYVAKTRKYLTSHIRRLHKSGSKRHKCNVCGMTFLCPSNLKNHSYVHTGEKPFKCNVCGKDFRQKYSLGCHMLIHTDEKPHRCSFCDYACRDSSTLRKHEHRHMGIVKMYNCTICRKKFPERAKLKYHISSVHLDYLDVMVNKHPCGFCDKSFKHKHLLNAHVTIVHERKFKCKCPICDKSLVNSYNLKQHMSSHFSERPYVCSFDGCKAAFKDKSSLKKHSVIHYPRLHHACKICQKTFSRVERRDRHMLIHYPKVKDVECDYCGVKFYSKNYLIRHINRKHCVESQKKKYVCEHCDFVTHNKPSIVMHLKYGMCTAKVFKCKLCKYKPTYKRLEYLRNHYLRTHNVRYKPRKLLKKKKKKRPSIEIKVEPAEEEEPEEIVFMEIDKQERDPENEYLSYSKHVLSEDLAEYMLDETASENTFDRFLKSQVFNQTAKQEDDPTKNVKVDESQLVEVKQKIMDLLKRTQEEKKRRQELKEKIREEKMKIRKRKREIGELRKVREFYNKRMREAAERQRAEKDKQNKNNNGIQAIEEILLTNEELTNENEINECEKQSQVNDTERVNDDDDIDDMPLSERLKMKRKRNKHKKSVLDMQQCYECYKMFDTKKELDNHRTKSHGVVNLRNTNVKQMDKKNRELKDKMITKTKLVKNGDEWIIEKVPIELDYVELPVFTLNELRNMYVTGNYADRLGQLNQLAKKKGIKMVFPCDHCEKICQNLSALKLHSRRHDPNKKPFRPKRWKHKGDTPYQQDKVKYDPTIRETKPAPITHKHKCDAKLMEFYETHIRGAKIEFWQFLKIYNKMERENIRDFKDFEGRTDFGTPKQLYGKTEGKQNTEGSGRKFRKEKGLANNFGKKCRKEKGLTNNFGKGKSYGMPISGKTSERPVYKRTVLISRKMQLAREAMKAEMRKRIAQNHHLSHQQ